MWIGLGLVGAVLGLLKGSNQLFPHPWPAIVLFATVTLAVVMSGAWLWRALPREQTRAENVSYADLLRRLVGDFAIRGDDLRDIPPTRGRVGIVVLLLVPTALLFLGLAWLPNWMGAQAAAGRGALERGYLLAEQQTTLIPIEVHPVTVSLRRPGVDPMDVCGRVPSRAASLITSDDHTRWVLLRPIAVSDSSPAVVLALSTADYLVHSVADRHLPGRGQPWAVSACQQLA
jgi:hypothetical protein